MALCPSRYAPEEVCNVIVQTNHGTCEDYCASQGLICRHAQDNVGSGCELNHDHHEQQTMSQNGCLQQWNGQVCGCGPRKPKDGGHRRQLQALADVNTGVLFAAVDDCKDCAGVPHGGAVLDVCGVCDGDGSSCR